MRPHGESRHPFGPDGGQRDPRLRQHEHLEGRAGGINLRELTAASINRSAITNNRNSGGVRLELTTATATISNSLLANNAAGITHAAAGGAPTSFLCGSTVTGNTTAGLQISSGSITSLGNNVIRGNVGNQTPTTTITTQ